MRQYWKSVIMMLVYSVLLFSNQLLTRFFQYFLHMDSCVLGILFVNPIMLAMVV